MWGPFRVNPGRLSVSRSFGDIHAKVPEYGGMPNWIIAVPEITQFKIRKDWDFVILASDGVYDKMNNDELVSIAW